LQPGVAVDDPEWQAKCKQYWELQERLFGFRASPFAMMVDNDIGAVSTFVTVMEVLPGPRTLDYSLVPVEMIVEQHHIARIVQ
jgi:hypothetical protein